MATVYRIHPSIGIARLGTSQEYFVGPEMPGIAPQDEFRDGSPSRLLKRQAARFRIFAHDDSVPDDEGRDVTNDPSIRQITWTVELANKKPSWFKFEGRKIEGPQGHPAGHEQRNQGVVNNRRSLEIHPGPRNLTGANGRQEFRRGTSVGFPEQFPPVFADGRRIETLGEIRTDSVRRLEVIGGFGISGSPNNAPIPEYANNDDWFDDTSDGSVTALLTLEDGSTVDAVPSWVIVGPPDFAPELANIVTMHDVLYDLGLRHFAYDESIFSGGAYRPDYRPSFTNDVYPILKRAYDYRWVYSEIRRKHDKLINFTALTKPPSQASDHQKIIEILRNPNIQEDLADVDKMPMLYGDDGDSEDNPSRLALTKTQYEIMRLWSIGQFVNDWPGQPPTPLAVITAEGLDRASMESCVGGAFFPGIEAGWILRDPRIFLTAFRLNHAAEPNGVTAGDVTKRSALPWQADFLDCRDIWWPAQRPNDAFVPAENKMSRWARGVSGHADMVTKWSQLGLVRNRGSGTNPDFVEIDRTLVP